MSEGSSYRQILRSSSIIGGASVVNILVGLVRTKIVAVLLGPTGVGLIGLLTNLMGVAAAVSGLGFGNVGTRQIADAAGREDDAEVAAARRALFWGTLCLALVGGVLFWSLRPILADRILSGSASPSEVGWLALGVALSVASASQGALLNGMRRIGDMARVSVYSAVLSSTLGVTALWLWGRGGLIAFVLAGSLASFLLGHLYVARLPKVQMPPTSLAVLWKQWRTLAALGAAFMVASLGWALGQLLVRTLIQRELGAEALGHFQAAWSISMIYIGFVLTAMGSDYFPRLTAAMGDSAAANCLVNEQTEVALLLAGPVLLAMLGLAPCIIQLMYSSDFVGAAEVLRWQVLGDVLKISSWPLGFIMLAAGDSRAFMLSELLATSVFVALTWVGLPLIGIEATGVAFVGMYLVYLPVVYWLARRKTGFAWEASIRKQFGLLVVGAVIVFLAVTWLDWIGVMVGLLVAAIFGLHSFTRLAHMTEMGGPLGKLAAFSRVLLIKTGAWRE